MRLLKNTSFLVGVSIILALFIMVNLTCFAAPKLTLKMGHEQNVRGGTQICAETLQDLIERRTNGEIAIEIYPQGSLSSSPEELLEFLRSGIVDLSISSTGNISGFCTDLQFLDIPFLVNSHEHVQVFAQSLPMMEIYDIFEKEVGVKVLDICETGNGGCITSNGPIRSFEDMKDLKIRCMMNPSFVAIYEAFGASPTPIDWGELYTSLELGAVDAQDNSPYIDWVMGFMEVQDSMAMLRQYWSGGVFLVSKNTWDKLTPEQQSILQISVQEACALERQWIHGKDLEAVEVLESQGKTITYPDKEPFREAAKPLLEKLFNEHPQWRDWYEQVQIINPDTRKPKAEESK